MCSGFEVDSYVFEYYSVAKMRVTYCRGVNKTDAMGMAIVGADGRWRLRGGIVRVAAHTKNQAHQDLPRFRALERR